MSSPRHGMGSARIVVTGLGLRTALGPNRDSTWSGLLAGRVGARWLDVESGMACPKFAGYPIEGSPLCSSDQIVEATREAIADARICLESRSIRDRVATVLGLSKGDLGSLGRMHARQLADGAHAASFDWGVTPGGTASRVAEIWDLTGPSLAPVAACATGLVAVLRAFDLIRRGECDLALAGAGDASLDPLVLGAFRRMGVLARLHPDEAPTLAVRPLDRTRSGFLPGEGAAVIVLERLDRALARGATIYAEVCGGAMGSDAHHLTDLDPDPTTLSGVIERALHWSGVHPREVGHVNLHATATRSNDPLECAAMARVLGSRSGEVLAVANKAQIGHTLGAAGAVELAITCLSLHHGVVPPTLNRNEPDPLCGLRTSPVAEPCLAQAALKISLGFGGHLAALVLKRFSA